MRIASAPGIRCRWMWKFPDAGCFPASIFSFCPIAYRHRWMLGSRRVFRLGSWLGAELLAYASGLSAKREGSTPLGDIVFKPTSPTDCCELTALFMRNET